MKTRVIAGLCMAPLLVILYFGGVALSIAWLFIAIVGVKEFYEGWENIDVKPSKNIAFAMIVLLYIIYFIYLHFVSDHMRGSVLTGLKHGMQTIPLGANYLPYVLMIWVVLAIAVSLIYGWKIDRREPYDAIATLTGLVYVVFFSFHLLLLDRLQSGHIFIWTVVLSAFGSDIFAYFTGMLFGKIKLAPNLSPKKTVEGSAGGVIGAGILCLVFGLIFAKEYVLQCFLIGIIGGAVSQAGDLTASAFKRKMGIKDYGNLIPGHGGIMDRFDSVIFVAPFVYYLVLLTIEINL